MGTEPAKTLDATAALRQAIERRFPDAVPLAHATVGGVGTGVAAVDALLPGGGLPRGRLTAWVPGGGASAVLRASCTAVVAAGERAAWIDGAGTVTADGWAAGPLLLRPSGEVEALACAEELLQSGGFGLVVVTGLSRNAARCGVRLSRAAKSGGSGLVLVGPVMEVAALRVECGITAEDWRWRADPFGAPGELGSVRIRLEARSLGWSGATTFDLPVWTHAPRASLDPLLVDRRGVMGRRAAWRRAQAGRGTRTRTGATTAAAPSDVSSTRVAGTHSITDASYSVDSESDTIASMESGW